MKCCLRNKLYTHLILLFPFIINPKTSSVKLITKLLLALVGLVLLIVIVGIFLPRQVRVQRSLSMNAPTDVIYGEINNLKSWPKWSAWHRLDPKMEITYAGPEAGPGASYSWKSTHKDVGNGTMSITSGAADSIATQMDFMEHGKASATFRFTKDGNATKVTWTMLSDMGSNPVAKLFGFLFMDKMVGSDFEKGLHNLDSVSAIDMKNKQAGVVTYQIQNVKVEPVMCMTVRRSCSSVDSIGSFLGSMYGEIGASMGKQGIQLSGPVFAIYHVFSPDKIDFEAGVPCDKMGKDDGNVKARQLPAVNALCIDYYGPYNAMKPAYDQLQSYIKTNSKEVSGSPWEVYVGDPGKEKDPSKVLTKIYYPVK